MRKWLPFFLVLVAIALVGLVGRARGQTPGEYELSCPSGSSPLGTGKTFNAATNKWRAHICASDTGDGTMVCQMQGCFTPGGSPLTMTNPGLFVDTATHDYVSVLLNGLNPTTEYDTYYTGNVGHHATEGVVSGVVQPATATNTNTNAIAGYVVANADRAGLNGGGTAGGYFVNRVNANNAAAWGINPVVVDRAGLTGHWLIGNEIDMNVSGSPNLATGLLVTGFLTGTLPANSHAIAISFSGGQKLTSAIETGRGFTDRGLVLSAKDATNPSDSQAIQVSGFDAGGNPMTALLNVNAAGAWVSTAPLNLASYASVDAPAATPSYFLKLGGVTKWQIYSGGSDELNFQNGTTNVFTISHTGNLSIPGGVANNAAGFKHIRGVTGCTTAAAAGAVCTTVVSWTTAFADANYTAQCGGRVIASGVPSNGGLTAQAAGSVTFQTVAITAVAAKFTNIDCVAVHD